MGFMLEDLARFFSSCMGENKFVGDLESIIEFPSKFEHLITML